MYVDIAHILLRNVRGNHMKNTLFQRTANAVIVDYLQEVKDKIRTDRREILQYLPHTEDKVLRALLNTLGTNIPTSEISTNDSLVTEMERANMSINNTVALELMKILKEVRNDTKQFKKQNSNNNRRPPKITNTTSDKDHQKKKRRRTNISKYCWSCGT